MGLGRYQPRACLSTAPGRAAGLAGGRASNRVPPGDNHGSNGDASPVPGLLGRTRRDRASVLAVVIGLAIGSLLPTFTRAAPPDPDAPADQLVPPKPKNGVTIRYPDELLERAEPPAGTVVVQYVVGVDGKTKELELLQSVDPA